MSRDRAMPELERKPNLQLRHARGEMSQARLAELVNTEILHATGHVGAITAKSVSDWECGWYRWPSRDARAALRKIFDVADDVDLGFERRRANRAQGSSEQLGSSGAERTVSLLELQSDELAQATEYVDVPGGRSFPGVELTAVITSSVPAENGVMCAPSGELIRSLERPHRRTLLVTSTANADAPIVYLADGREFAASAVRGAETHSVPAAYRLDDLTVGIVWAVANTDSAILADDGALDLYQRSLMHYEESPASSPTLSEVPKLSDVSRQWLGSCFCAGYITRSLTKLRSDPFFWSREQSGEEASSWLLWTHKLDYLRHTASRYAQMRRGFCIPEHKVRASPRYERVLLLLALALMEASGIETQVSTETELGEIEGFVLAEDLIVANWLRGPGVWYVDTDAPAPRWRTYQDLSKVVVTDSIVARPTPAGRLQALAAYLDISWTWFSSRCLELAAAGVDGIVHPRSRLLSTDGLMIALRFVANLNQSREIQGEASASS